MIPLGQTLGLWQSLLMAGVLVVVSMAIAYGSAPSDADARGMEEMGVSDSVVSATARTPTNAG